MKRNFSRYLKFEFLFCFLVLYMKFFLVDYFIVKSNDMAINLYHNDLILFKKYTYGASVLNASVFRRLGLRQKGSSVCPLPKRGELVLCFFDHTSKNTMVQRVIAIEGDSVQIINGDIYLNDKLLEKTFVKTLSYIDNTGLVVEGDVYSISLDGYVFLVFVESDFQNGQFYNTQKHIIPPGCLWVQSDSFKGDTLANSEDHVLPVRNLLGKPFVVLVGSSSLKKESCYSLLNIILRPFRILNYCWNIETKRIWKLVR